MPLQQLVSIWTKGPRETASFITLTTHLLVFPELSFDGHRDLVVLQLPAIEQLLQEVAFSGFLADQVS